MEEDLRVLNEKVIQFGMNDMDFEKESSLKTNLVELLKREEVYWRDKSRELWIEARESNTKFFHSFAKSCRDANRIEEVKYEGRCWHSSVEDIENIVIRHFKSLLGLRADGDNNLWVTVAMDIQGMVLQEENDLLI